MVRPGVRQIAETRASGSAAPNGEDLEVESGGGQDSLERVDRRVDAAGLDTSDGRPGDVRVRSESSDREPGGSLRVRDELTDVHDVSIFAHTSGAQPP